MIDEHLSRITTIWSTIREAHEADDDQAARARCDLVERYQGAAFRYLLGALRDVNAAEDVFQEFALRVVLGRFSGADAEKGRFRDYLRTTLIRMVTDYYRRRQRAAVQLADGGVPETADEELPSFEDSWRDELLHLVWTAMQASEEAEGHRYYTVLKLRVDQPELRSVELADQLNHRLNPDSPYTEAGVRKAVQRAREMFAKLLVYEVSQSIESNERERVERELIDLRLLPYCRSAL